MNTHPPHQWQCNPNQDLPQSKSNHDCQSPSIAIATPADTKIICPLGKSTFFNAYKDILPAEDLNAYIDHAFSFELIKKELTHPDTLCLLAQDKAGVRGYAKFFPSPLPANIADPACIELQRLYTAIGFEGKGIGKALMQEGERLLLERSYQSVWLKVWIGNTKAQNIYRHWGFHLIGQDAYNVGNSVRQVVLMKKKLIEQE